MPSKEVSLHGIARARAFFFRRLEALLRKCKAHLGRQAFAQYTRVGMDVDHMVGTGGLVDLAY